MKENSKKGERAALEVEAAFILPIAILSVLLLLYLSLILCQRANLQAVLETAVIYYKNILTDTYLYRTDEVMYENMEQSRVGSGNSYKAEEPLNPYTARNASKELKEVKQFETYFRSISGDMLFDENLELTIDYRNYALVKQIDVTATQTIELPIDFRILGIEKEYEITATARVTVANHDATIRNVDYAIDLLEDTKLGQMAGQLAGKVSEFYNTFKTKLGV